MSSKHQAPSSNFKTRFQHLANSDMNSDCEFVVGIEKTLIKGHKLIFGKASEVFQAMFFGNLREEKPVRVEDLDPDGFRGMKTFIYTGEVDFTSVFHALATYIAARKYIIPDLSVECVKYIDNQIKPSEVLEFLDRCLSNVIDQFTFICCKIIQEKTDEVLASKYFVSTSFRMIEFILKAPTLKLSSEIELYEHFERWALADVQRLNVPAVSVSTRFNYLKKHIRFLTISSDEFVSRVAPSILLTQEEKFAIALNKMKFDSKMTTNTISMTLQSRNFNKPLPENHHHLKHMFEIRITHNNSPHNFSKPIRSNSYNTSEQKINLIPKLPLRPGIQAKNELTVHWTLFDEYLSFEAKSTNYTQKNELVIIKTKFRVLSVLNECDDLVFENESRYICCPAPNYSSEYQGNVILAVIPTSTLNSSRYKRNNLAVIAYNYFYVNVEGTFDVRVLNL
ncbi:hypothetical protein LSTR_LSTR010622 [Laodelphax striatellus]|uniref:BTB domain-containing protein n=1 Tax=Laodelphax striatellus TaxID=195883 RepID=A0A482X4V4_LAOST|nr:hypothetical protein LSTR_LSTR010622 [Laodelphax striatellus]